MSCGVSRAAGAVEVASTVSVFEVAMAMAALTVDPEKAWAPS